MQSQEENGSEASVEFQPLNVLDECPENPQLGGSKRLSLVMLMSLGTKLSTYPYIPLKLWGTRTNYNFFYRFHCKLREPV